MVSFIGINDREGMNRAIKMHMPLAFRDHGLFVTTFQTWVSTQKQTVHTIVGG